MALDFVQHLAPKPREIEIDLDGDGEKIVRLTYNTNFSWNVYKSYDQIDDRLSFVLLAWDITIDGELIMPEPMTDYTSKGVLARKKAYQEAWKEKINSIEQLTGVSPWADLAKITRGIQDDFLSQMNR